MGREHARAARSPLCQASCRRHLEGFNRSNRPGCRDRRSCLGPSHTLSNRSFTDRRSQESLPEIIDNSMVPHERNKTKRKLDKKAPEKNRSPLRGSRGRNDFRLWRPVKKNHKPSRSKKRAVVVAAGKERHRIALNAEGSGCKVASRPHSMGLAGLMGGPKFAAVARRRWCRLRLGFTGIRSRLSFSARRDSLVAQTRRLDRNPSFARTLSRSANSSGQRSKIVEDSERLGNSRFPAIANDDPTQCLETA
jgi:hypothetical protein